MHKSGSLNTQWWRVICSAGMCILIVVMTIAAQASNWMQEERCNYFRDTLISGGSTPSVVVVQRLCDGTASSDDMLVELVWPTGKRATVFSFEAAHSFVRKNGEADPQAAWIDSKTLKISVGKIASIKTKRNHVGDIRVQYEIGSVIFKERPPG